MPSVFKLASKIALIATLALPVLGTSLVADARGNGNNAPKIEKTKAGLEVQESNALDELDPFSPDIDKQLEEMDQEYSRMTNKSPWLSIPYSARSTGCYRSSCAVYAYVRRSDQKMYLDVNGNPHGEYFVSTGAPGHDTPNFDRRPNGRIYDQYSSSKFPGGNYQGLGNMPYAVFIEGGFAIHGTTKGNFKLLGRKASHGCVRMHPDHAFIFNRLVRQYGIANTWIHITE